MNDMAPVGGGTPQIITKEIYKASGRRKIGIANRELDQSKYVWGSTQAAVIDQFLISRKIF